jgi:hypothetical protein
MRSNPLQFRRHREDWLFAFQKSTMAAMATANITPLYRLRGS